MANEEAAAKVITGSTIVLKGTLKNGVKFTASADNFGLHDFEGAKVSGDAYYVKKAKDQGAI